MAQPYKELWTKTSRLLDQVLELDPSKREPWLAALEASHPAVAAQLRELLALHAANCASGFMERSPLGDESLAGECIGAYTLERALGRGGMGSVWLARRSDGKFEARVAIKLLDRRGLGEAAAGQIRHEATLLARLTHPNIARLFDAGVRENGQPYLILEYVEGDRIDRYSKAHQLTLPDRLRLFVDVADAVAHAHAQLIVHRDLKPSNVLVTPAGVVKLLDFGVAALQTGAAGAERAPESEVPAGALTPGYASPEQLLGEPAAAAADVYSLGVLLYVLITGEHPFGSRAPTHTRLVRAALTEDPSLASARLATAAERRWVRGDLDAIIAHALSRNAAQRYATAAELAADVRRFLGDFPVRARPTKRAYIARKFAQRHLGGILSVLLILFVLIGGLATTTHEARIASAERDAALQAQLRSLTQTAAARLKDGDVSGAMSVILEVLQPKEPMRTYTPEALSVFQEARAADAQVLAITGHGGPVRSVAFAPDGRRIATASYDGTARIWGLPTGHEILRLGAHRDRVLCVMFSPDGRRLVTASTDKTARVWDASTGQQIALLQGHADEVVSGAFSPDGERIVTASYDKMARVWDVKTGREIARFGGHKDIVTAAMFSPDGRFVITASSDHTARIWDAASGRAVTVLAGHAERVWSAAFAPDGRRAVTASFDRTARIWDVGTGHELVRLVGHTGWVTAASFSPDGQYVVTASFDGTARIWDSVSGEELERMSGHTDWLLAAVFSPDGSQIATASKDGTSRIWDAQPRQLLRRLVGHSGEVGFAAYSADGRRIVTASVDKSARIWDAETGRELVRLNGHTGWVTSAQFSPDGRRVVTASFDKTARIWDAWSGRELLQLSGHTDRVWFAAFSPDGRRVVTASIDRSARVWDASTARELVMLSGHTDRVWSAQFSPDGRRIVTASDDRSARIWDAANGRQLVRLSGHGGTVSSAAFSPDGRRVVTASLDRTARLWDAATGRQVMLLSGHKDVVDFARFSPDGRHVITAGDDKTVRIWDAQTGLQLAALKAHRNKAETAVFSPDASRVVTAGSNDTPRIWDARIPPLRAQIAWAAAAQFDALSSDERFQLGLPPTTSLEHSNASRGIPPGADPNVLAHAAESAESAAWLAPAEHPEQARARLLEAFKYYAAAAERAREEGWPDGKWRNWRYSRASLARLLAREGMTQEVARAYDPVQR